MRRCGNIFEGVVDFNRLCLSAKRAAIGTRTIESFSFMADLEREVFRLQSELLSRSYCPGEYITFAVKDPKPRTISASPFRDRVVHHALCAALDPLLERYLIDDCYACRVGKGTVAAIDRAHCFAGRYAYYAKLDVRHFFETADHQILKNAISRLVKDPAIIWLADLFIDKGAPGSMAGKGLPIGNLTSQNFANLYLGAFDHFMKEIVRVPGYVRYMDDILMFDNNRLRLRDSVGAADLFMKGIRLELKDEVCRRGRTGDGIAFLGFNIFPSFIRFDHCRRRRFARRVTAVTKKFQTGEVSFQHLLSSMQSLIGWAGIGDTAAFTRCVCGRNQIDS